MNYYTTIEKIFLNHLVDSSGTKVKPGDIVDIKIDVRCARDFGGANVVGNLKGLPIDDPTKTFFTFDCNPTASDTGYANNQQLCRNFARANNIKVFDIDEGIGTHTIIDKGIILPGGTAVSTDSHANILGAIGAFGQGMGDIDIAGAFSRGTVWFEVPPTIKVIGKGKLTYPCTAKDLTLALLRHFGANGLLNKAVEFTGEIFDSLSLDERITLCSMITEMGGIIGFVKPSKEVLNYSSQLSGKTVDLVWADEKAEYEKVIELDFSNLELLISKPGHPEDVVPLKEVKGKKIDSVFIGSCTNGRYEDMQLSASILKGRKIADGVVLKIVPSTREIWSKCLKNGIIEIFESAGALVSNPGCAGCAAGQVGMNGKGEVVVSTGNRNFAGKQGQGDVYLASPLVASASAIAGYICSPDEIASKTIVPVVVPIDKKSEKAGMEESKKVGKQESKKATIIKGKIWVIEKDNIDTDMIFHNKHLAITNIEQMGQYAFGNLPGWEDFPKKVQPNDILVINGKNFGCGSSRQQAVDCFKSLKVSLILANSFGAIYWRNAVNSAMPVMMCDGLSGLRTGDEIEVNLETGEIKNITNGQILNAKPFSKVQMEIYQRGGLL